MEVSWKNCIFDNERQLFIKKKKKKLTGEKKSSIFKLSDDIKCFFGALKCQANVHKLQKVL